MCSNQLTELLIVSMAEINHCYNWHVCVCVCAYREVLVRCRHTSLQTTCLSNFSLNVGQIDELMLRKTLQRSKLGELCNSEEEAQLAAKIKMVLVAPR